MPTLSAPARRMRTFTFDTLEVFSMLEIHLGLAPSCGYVRRKVTAKGYTLADAMERHERAANAGGGVS